MEWTIGSPSPVPFAFVVKNGLKMLCTTSCGIPPPVSLTWNTTPVPSPGTAGRVETERVPVSPIAWIALETRFHNTCRNWSGSTEMTGSSGEKSTTVEMRDSSSSSRNIDSASRISLFRLTRWNAGVFSLEK